MENNNSKKTSAADVNEKPAKSAMADYFSDLDLSELEVKIEDMFKSGVHFGHHKSRKDPRMGEYIFTTKNNINILDLEKTKTKLESALEFMRNVISSGEEILFVGTKKQAKEIVVSAAKRCDMPYVTERWLGGTFTNFPVISGRTRYLREGLEKMKQGEYAKYTKFEQMKKQEELTRMERRMGGIKNMNKLPGAIFTISVIEDNLAIKEARNKNIPIISLVDTNVNPKEIDYPIPANEDAVSSIKLVMSYVVKAVLEGKEKKAVIKVETKESTNKESKK